MTCYADVLGGCGGGQSREHYLSAGILRALDDGRNVRVAGLPFLNGGAKLLPPSGLAVKVLCQHHNSELNPLDDEALKLYREIDALDALAGKTGVQPTASLNGNLIERWMLKFMLGVIAGGFARLPDGTPAPCDVPRDLVKICFGRQSHDRYSGLYLDGELGDRVSRPTIGLTAGIALNPDATLAHVHVDMNRLHLVHHLDGTKPTPSRYHRPRALKFVHETSGARKTLFFKWASSHGGTRWIQYLVHAKRD